MNLLWQVWSAIPVLIVVIKPIPIKASFRDLRFFSLFRLVDNVVVFFYFVQRGKCSQKCISQ